MTHPSASQASGLGDRSAYVVTAITPHLISASALTVALVALVLSLRRPSDRGPILLEDQRGIVRVSLSAEGDSAYLALYDGARKLRAQLLVDSVGTPRFVFYDASGRVRSWLALDKMLSFVDHQGQVRPVPQPDSTTGVNFVLYGADPHAQLALRTDDRDYPSVQLTHPAPRLEVLLDMSFARPRLFLGDWDALAVREVSTGPPGSFGSSPRLRP